MSVILGFQPGGQLLSLSTLPQVLWARPVALSSIHLSAPHESLSSTWTIFWVSDPYLLTVGHFHLRTLQAPHLINHKLCPSFPSPKLWPFTWSPSLGYWHSSPSRESAFSFVHNTWLDHKSRQIYLLNPLPSLLSLSYGLLQFPFRFTNNEGSLWSTFLMLQERPC